ncbi:hypothetical protein BDU57DRAFT_524576 [Ampelomyces quisqualis]|uniref:JmjC domain-containing protein n=1 Tax=Ampelomyces quisqualis TaxID=50730 RepID=A0A6A5Q6F8_AMPQU|nr:hypothetical protein BDU57DRAFT_524576 [Ampelomyces quisqualis]
MNKLPQGLCSSPDTTMTPEVASDLSISSTPSDLSESQPTHYHAPTMAETIQLTCELLTTDSATDPIRECGRAALLLLPSNPTLCQELAYQNLHTLPYSEVKTCWRRLYTDATLWKVVGLARAQGNAWVQEQTTSDEWLCETVRMLDMALILTGAPEREEVVELWFSALQALPLCEGATDTRGLDKSERLSKRRKLAPNGTKTLLPSSFSTVLPEPAPVLQFPTPRTRALSMSTFQTKLSDPSQHTPILITEALQHWPAIAERPWNNPHYLLDQTLGGRRLVPIEIGRSYTDDDWGQKIITFHEFMETYMLSNEMPIPAKKASKTGYLAQHNLFSQIPSLRADISIPDYCYCSPAPSLPEYTAHIKPVPRLNDPLLNAWFGPKGTVSPLHTDPYHNVLAQAVGYKYVRLYAPTETEKLYPRGKDDKGIDMSNTSRIDLDQAMRACGESPFWHCSDEDGAFDAESWRREFPMFKDARYMEAILSPGACLYIPVGWWHYVRSLTSSLSVSFWFN